MAMAWAWLGSSRVCASPGLFRQFFTIARHGCSRNAMFGQLDTPPKFVFHAWIHIATAHPVAFT